MQTKNITINVDQIQYVKLFDEIKNTDYFYLSEKKGNWFNQKVVEGFYYIECNDEQGHFKRYTKLITSDELINLGFIVYDEPELLIEEKSVYFKSHIEIHYSNDVIFKKEFDTYEEANKYFSKISLNINNRLLI